MKRFFFGSWLRGALTTGLALLAGPPTLMYTLAIPNLIYPDDCGIGFQCEHAIVQYAGSMSFGMLILGLPIMILGGCVLVVTALLYGIRALRSHQHEYRRVKIALGVAAALMLLFAVWIPNGPDECSGSVMARQYNACLEKELAGKTEAEARTWLEARGYKTFESNQRGEWGSVAHDEFRGTPSVTTSFNAYRSYERPHSLPYGTYFARYILPMFPAPATYKIGVGINTAPHNTYEVYTDWSFSFL